MRVEELNSREKEEFKRVCNILLSHSLITKHKENNKKDYYFIENNTEAINEYLEILGFEIEVNKTLKVAHLINKFGTNKLNFNLIESITLLIFRILYQEKMEEITLSKHVLIEVDELHNKFIALGFRDKQMDKTQLRNTLQRLKKFNIIETLDRDVTAGDARVIIYPTIQMVVRSGNIDTIYERLQSYNGKAGEDNEEVDGA
ncbi:MAG: DUF4194 domain-containing protein [Clostridium sp.]|uniref:DUF4194 domain-containing protein n=1 Tax=Clostridium sp. TaxID=1506 RepID=UPI003F37B3C0